MLKKSMKLSDNLGKSIGKVYNVDTKKILVNVESEEVLNHLKINDITIFSGNNADEKLIGIVAKVSKKALNLQEDEDCSDIDELEEENYCENYCSVVLVGSFYNKIGAEKKIFLNVQ